MDTSSSTTTVTGPQPDFTVAAECGRGLLLQLERCKNLPSVQDGVQWATMSEKLDNLADQMKELITTVNTMKTDVAGLKTDVAGLNEKITTLDQNSIARSVNSFAAGDTPFTPLTNINTGLEIQGPANVNDVKKMTEARLSSCLQELGITPKSTIAEKRIQVLRAYGVKFQATGEFDR
ncbi:hypothetical protein E4U19_007796 [Claviceps sp. Clav32 group G5]|nr:hypothetical protein E4U19_007796 [Claviceps sp. Clav32 group G5]